MKIRKKEDRRRDGRCVLQISQRTSRVLKDVPKYGKINSLEVDEVLFYLLDGLVDQDEGITSAITNSLLKFAQTQPEFTLKSILSFLEVRRTSISHQYSLLLVMRKCILQCKSVLSNAAIKEILLFMLKELNFISTSDTRHMEMREIVNATSVLCPGFSVDVILAFIQDMRSNERSADIMCIYIQILTHLCALVPKNTYICKSLVSSCIMSMFSEDIFRENNSELCKDLSTFLYALSNMLAIQYKVNIAEESPETLSLCDGINVEDCAYRRFLCYQNVFRAFELGRNPGLENTMDDKSFMDETVHYTRDCEIKRSLSCGFSPDIKVIRKDPDIQTFEYSINREYASFMSINSDIDEEVEDPLYIMERYVSIESPEPIGTVEPIFPLMMEKYLPTIYTNASYNVTCMEVFYSLVIFSQHITDVTFSKYAASLLDSMIVRFHNYLPNLQYRHVSVPDYANTWIKLYKSASATFGSKIITLFSSIGYSMDRYVILPPTYFVRSLRLYVQILEKRSPYTLCVQLFNICGVLFGLLHGLFEYGSEYFEAGNDHQPTIDTFLSVNKSFLNTNDRKECKTFIYNIRETYGLLFSNNLTSLVLLEFLFQKLKSDVVSEVTVSLYILFILYSSFLDESELDGNCSKIWHLINELDELVKRFKGDPFSSRLILLLLSYLSRGKWFTFHSISIHNVANRNARIMGIHGIGKLRNSFRIGISKQVINLLNFVFNLKVNYDIEKRINQSKVADIGFLRAVYEGVPKIVDKQLHVAIDTCFDSFIPRYSAEVLLVYLVKMLVKNKKRNVLTIFRSLLGILNQNDPRRILLVLSVDLLMKLMTYALIYMHDPVCYLEEAVVASNIVNLIAHIIFDRGRRYMSITSNSSIPFYPYGSMSPCGPLSNVGSPCSDDMNDYNVDLNTGDITENFGRISKFLSKILDENKISSAQYVKVIIKTLGSIIATIKRRTSIQSSYNTFYKSDQSPSPLHTAYHMMGILNILSVCARTSIRMTSDLINLLIGLPKQNVLHVLEYSLHFYENYEVYRLLPDVYEWSNLLNVSEEIIFTMNTLRKNTKITLLQGVTIDEKIDNSQALQQQLQTLRGFCISVLGASARNRKHVLLKVYYVLLMNIPKGTSSFTLFGKSTTILLSEKIRCICISALSHLYIQGLCPNIPVQNHDQDLCTRDIMNEMGNELKGYIDAMNAYDLAKLSLLYKEVFLKHFGISENSQAGKDVLSDNMNLECIIVPLISLLNTECESHIKLLVLRGVLNILSQEHLSLTRDFSLKYLISCTNGLLYFLSNPSIKEYTMKAEYDVSNIEGYYMTIFNNKGSTDDAFLDHKFIHNGESVNEVSFLSFIILCALSRHYYGISETLHPFSTLYCLLSYGDCYLSSRLKHLSLEDYASIDISNLLVYYMTNVIYSTDDTSSVLDAPYPDLEDCGMTMQDNWTRLSKILIVTLFVPPNMDENHVKHRILVTLSLLQCIRYQPRVLDEMDQEERDGWTKVVLLIWAHILRISSDNLLKLQLMRSLESILNIESLEYIRLDSSRLHALENCDKVNGIGKIDQLLPGSCLIPCMLSCINFLESWSLLSDSFAKIIHKILQHRYDEIDSKHLESVLITIFKRFSYFFQSENVPTFLRLFLIDLAKADFNILCNALFSKQQPCTKQFQISIIRIVSSDLYLLESVLEFLTSILLPSSDSVNNCPIDFVMEFTLEVLLGSYSQFITTKHGASFISALVIYLNSLEQPFKDALAILDRILVVLRSKGTPREFIQEEKQLNEQQKEWVLVDDIGKKIVAKSRRIIGHSVALKVAFLESMLFIIKDSSQNANFIAMLTIFSELMRHGHLVNQDDYVNSIFEQVPIVDLVEDLYFKSIHYYLKYEKRVPVHRGKGKDFEKIVSTLSGALSKLDTSYYICRALCSFVLLSLRKRVRVSEIVYKVIVSKPTPSEERTRYAYIQLHIAIIKWYNVHKRVVPLYIQRHMIHPLAVALASKGSERVILASRTYLYMVHSIMANFVSISDEGSLQPCKEDGLDDEPEIDGRCTNNISLRGVMEKGSESLHADNWNAFLESLIVKGVYTGKSDGKVCFCGCNSPLLKHTGKYRVCLGIAFYLLLFFSSTLPCKNIELETPQDIENEFKMIKKNELDHRSSVVLFGDSFANSTRMEWPIIDANDSSDFYNIDEICSLRLESSSEKCQPLKKCPRDLLKILQIADYTVNVDGSLSRINIPFKNDKMDITNILIANNAAFFDISNLKPILKSVLFTSPTIYRFCLSRKYLLSPSAFVCKNLPAYDAFSGECIELCTSIISICSLYINKEIEDLKCEMKNNWPNCFLEILRFNAIMHFEALSTAVTKKLCNILEGDDLGDKRSVFKAMELFAHIKCQDT
ncbi:conserved hypothetical protein [Theileria equi strain WA]|uniref:Uncharacterized protein n=1 Tax=Theileria equi strain WA TaxID=1537102 RepID=L1LB43_THEEQ|nr:conserved hypothetical protein [Theileria equi strain WA]EKX72495.1 conserved hypothetical protein [Theileria equi strain WA]|eukprot:XP_004831947.1 conserved hypothetical protein [Theileria equi strain WA]